MEVSVNQAGPYCPGVVEDVEMQLELSGGHRCIRPLRTPSDGVRLLSSASWNCCDLRSSSRVVGDCDANLCSMASRSAAAASCSSIGVGLTSLPKGVLIVYSTP